MKMEFYLNHATVELQIQKTQNMLQTQLKTVWNCHSHGSARIIKAKCPEIIQEKECSQVHPVTGNDSRLCLFDRYHEGNMSSEIESLRNIGSILS